MNIKKNVDLRNYNTFCVSSIAENFVEINSVTDIQNLTKINYFDDGTLILGGGSNILLVSYSIKNVAKINIQGINLIYEDENEIYLKVGAGENWHEFVEYTYENNWHGLENLVLIPGSVGAAPVQNIGAYGVEQKEFCHSVEVFLLKENKVVNLKNEECNFTYRDSIFKNELKGNFVIISVTYKLQKKFEPNLYYQDLKYRLTSECTPKELLEAVIEIRTRKLPDVNVYGNAGSFFQNPIVKKEKVERIAESYPKIKYFPYGDENHKLAAAWLIDSCRLKGFRIGDAGVSEMHPLILVNYGNASGKEIFEVSEKVIHSVLKKFDVQLVREVNII